MSSFVESDAGAGEEVRLEAQIAKLQGKIEAGFNTGSNHDRLDEQDAQRELKQCQERLAAISAASMPDEWCQLSAQPMPGWDGEEDSEDGDRMTDAECQKMRADSEAAQRHYSETRGAEHDAARIREAQNPEQAAEFAQLSAANQASRKAAMEEGLFTLFARIDTDNSRSIDMEEFEAGIASDPILGRKLSKAFNKRVCDLSGAVRGAMQEDPNWDGTITMAQFEQLCTRGGGVATVLVGDTAQLENWKLRIEEIENTNWKQLEDDWENNDESDWYDSFEDFQGEEMENLQYTKECLQNFEWRRELASSDWGTQNGSDAARAANTESDPTHFGGGAVYALDADARKQRDLEAKEIAQLEHDEYLYKEDFKGLSAQEAMEIGEAREAEQRKGVVMNIDWNSLPEFLRDDLGRVSEATRLNGFLKKNGFSKYAAAIKDGLGVTEIQDLEYLERSDLAEVGLSNVDQQRFMAAVQRL